MSTTQTQRTTQSQQWQTITLEDIAASKKHSIKRGPWGGSLKKEIFVRSGYKVYEQKNVIYNNFRLGNYYIDDDKFSELKDFMISPGDVLISCSGTYGKVAVVPRNVEKGIINQALLKISPNNEKILTPYFKYLLESEPIQKYFLGLTHGSAIKNVVSVSTLKQMKFGLPSILEQQKIASILSKVDELIQKTAQIIELTQRLKKGLMQRLLIRGIGHTKFKKDFVAFSLYEKDIPSTWKISKLNQLCKVVRGGSPRPAGDPKYFGGKIPWITVGDLTKDDQMYLNSVEKGLTEEGKVRSRYLEKGTVLLANSGATLGIPKILNIAGCINDGIAAFLDLKNELLPEYLYYVLFSWIRNFRNINQGMGQPNLNTEIIGNLYLSLPPINEQRQIVLYISNIDLKLQKELLIYNQIENIKKGLMQKLLTGKIRVKV
jgi:type I restriction enzyme S subunit